MQNSGHPENFMFTDTILEGVEHNPLVGLKVGDIP